MKDFLLLSAIIALCISASGQVDCIDQSHYLRGDTLFSSPDSTKFSGAYRAYYPGKPKEMGGYANGVKHGRFTYFYGLDYDYGLNKEENYEYGKLNGAKDSFAWGYRILAENYVNGILDDTCMYFHESGQLEKLVIYDMGKVVESWGYPGDQSIDRLVLGINGISGTDITVDSLQYAQPLELTIGGIQYNFKNDDNTIDYKTMEAYEVLSFEASGSASSGKNSGLVLWTSPSNMFPPMLASEILTGKYKALDIKVQILNPQGIIYDLPWLTLTFH